MNLLAINHTSQYKTRQSSFQTYIAGTRGTGQMQVVISAAGAPAKEAVYTVKGVLFIEGKQSDVREFELRVRGSSDQSTKYSASGWCTTDCSS